MPTTPDVVGQRLFDEHEDCPSATTSTTFCERWEPKDEHTLEALAELDEYILSRMDNSSQD